MERFRAILRGTGVFLGVVAILLGGLHLFVLACLLGVSLIFVQPPWNFPGDPPLFDMARDALPWVLLTTGVPALLIAVGRGTRHPESRAVFRVLRAVVGVNLLFWAMAWTSMLDRRGPRWEGVRNAIRDRAARVEARTPASARALDAEGLRSFQQEITSAMPNEWVNLPGHGMVILRPVGYYPWVGVDFGNGGFAVFEDLETMECGHSD